jgi:hypothetical protein
MSNLNKVIVDKNLVKKFKQEGAEFHKVIKKYNAIRPEYEKFLADFIKRNIVKDDLFLKVIERENQSITDHCYDEPGNFFSNLEVLETVVDKFLSSISCEVTCEYVEETYEIKLTTYKGQSND